MEKHRGEIIILNSKLVPRRHLFVEEIPKILRRRNPRDRKNHPNSSCGLSVLSSHGMQTGRMENRMGEGVRRRGKTR